MFLREMTTKASNDVYKWIGSVSEFMVKTLEL